MTQTSWPFENADTTETQYSYLFDRLKTSGVAGFPNDTALQVTAPGGTMTVQTAAGFAIVRGFMYSSDAVVTNTISASSSNPRIDLIILRLDPSANSIVQAVLTGTPAVSPSAPALTQTTTGIYEIEIGRVTVPALATTIASGNVKDTRNCLSHGVGIWTTDSRPTSPTLGRVGWSTTNQVLEVWNGSAWKEAAPNNINASTITSGTISPSRIVGTASLNDGLVYQSDGTIGGARRPQMLSNFANNPTVGTTFTTTGTSLDVVGSTTYMLTFTAWVKDTDTNPATITARLTIGSNDYDHTTYIAAGFFGQVTGTRYFTSGATDTTNCKVRLKASTGSRNIDTTINVIGMN
jgi:hypothetical protein